MSYQGPQRQCVACLRTARAPRRDAKEPNILAICMQLYRPPGRGKSHVLRVRRVNVCETCLANARFEAFEAELGPESARMLSAIAESVWAGYNALLAGEADEPEPICR